MKAARQKQLAAAAAYRFLAGSSASSSVGEGGLKIFRRQLKPLQDRRKFKVGGCEIDCEFSDDAI